MPNSDNSGNANRLHRSPPDTGPSPCNYQTSGPVHNDPLEPHASSYQSSEPQPGSSQEYFAPITPHKPGSRLKSSCTDSSQLHRSPQMPASAAGPANFSITPLQFHSNSPTPYSTGAPSSPHSGPTTSTSSNQVEPCQQSHANSQLDPSVNVDGDSNLESTSSSSPHSGPTTSSPPNQAESSQQSHANSQQGALKSACDLDMAKATSFSSPDPRATTSTSSSRADPSERSHASPQLDSPVNVVDNDDNPRSTSSPPHLEEIPVSTVICRKYDEAQNFLRQNSYCQSVASYCRSVASNFCWFVALLIVIALYTWKLVRFIWTLMLSLVLFIWTLMLSLVLFIWTLMLSRVLFIWTLMLPPWQYICGLVLRFDQYMRQPETLCKLVFIGVCLYLIESVLEEFLPIEMSAIG